MVVIREEPDCGNAPRKTIVRDLVVALAMKDTDFVAPLIAGDVSWTVIGEQHLVGGPAILVWISGLPVVSEVVFGSLLTHGHEASVDGVLELSDGTKLGFCHPRVTRGGAASAEEPEKLSGLFWSSTSGAMLINESLLKLDFLWLKNFDPAVECIATQPFEMPGGVLTVACEAFRTSCCLRAPDRSTAGIRVSSAIRDGLQLPMRARNAWWRETTTQASMGTGG